MRNDEITSANRKALPKFILVMTILLFLSFAAGFFAEEYGLHTLADAIRSAGAFWGMYIAPWMMLSVAIVTPVICIPLYLSANKLISSWNGEDEDVYGIIDRRLSFAIWISNASLILSYFFAAASYSVVTDVLESQKITGLFLISVAALFAIIIETVIIQQKCVDATKKINPEKAASVYDMKFQKKWIGYCDEAERLLIGKCAFKAYNVTNRVCAVLAGVLAVCALIFGIGFLPFLSVCLIWSVNQSAYYREAIKYSKAGNKIS